MKVQVLTPGTIYLTDGGLETTMIFHRGITLNHFAAFELLLSEKGQKELMDYYQAYFQIAIHFGTGFILETPTWRANPEWGIKLGYNLKQIRKINTEAVHFLRKLARNTRIKPLIFSGQVGPRGDGYQIESKMTADEAADYHSDQMRALALADVDIVTALTLNYTEEATGVALAAKKLRVPVALSFTVETDGLLPSGESLLEAIRKTDMLTDNYPSYYMVNCAHPAHFKHLFAEKTDIAQRIKGIRANASLKSHAELEAAEMLDEGHKPELAQSCSSLWELLPSLQLIGGCCGTDHSHLEHICQHNLKRLQVNLHKTP